MATAVETARSSFIAPLSGVEWRDSTNHDDYTLIGHAAVFDRWSDELWTFAGTFREKVKRGAFTDVLKRSPDVRLYYNHDGLTLARTNAKTLELSEDEVGLRVWARVAPTQFARDLRMAMQRGDVDQMSFAFTVAEDEWREDHDEETVERTIVRVQDLYDVSIVAEPAYPDTDATMRELRAAAQLGRIQPRTVIPFRATPKLDPDTAWDGPAEVARADVDDLRAMCCWYDSNDPDVKGSYKLPHHRASESHPVVWRGVNTAMQRLFQTDIPDSDRRGVYNHLARHYEQFDKEPPDFEDLQRAAQAERDPAATTDTPLGNQSAGGVSGPHPRLVALRARGRRARLLTTEKGS